MHRCFSFRRRWLASGVLVALATFASTSSAAPSPPSADECRNACLDLDYAQRRFAETCAHASSDADREACAKRKNELDGIAPKVEAACTCAPILAEVRRERRASVGLGVSFPLGPRVTSELNLFEGKWSIAAFFGVGRLGTIDPVKDAPSGSVWSYEVGAQLRAYVAGSFSRFGVTVGVETLYRRAQVEDERLARAQGPGLQLGPVLGLRVADIPILHTVELQLGLGIVVWDRSAGGSRLAPHGGIGANWLF